MWLPGRSVHFNETIRLNKKYLSFCLSLFLLLTLIPHTLYSSPFNLDYITTQNKMNGTIFPWMISSAQWVHWHVWATRILYVPCLLLYWRRERKKKSPNRCIASVTIGIIIYVLTAFFFIILNVTIEFTLWSRWLLFYIDSPFIMSMFNVQPFLALFEPHSFTPSNNRCSWIEHLLIYIICNLHNR